MTQCCSTLGVAGSDAILYCLECADVGGHIHMSESKSGVSVISCEESFVVMVPTYFAKRKSSVSIIYYEENFIVVVPRILEKIKVLVNVEPPSYYSPVCTQIFLDIF
jgi:hypothetical protein